MIPTFKREKKLKNRHKWNRNALHISHNEKRIPSEQQRLKEIMLQKEAVKPIWAAAGGGGFQNNTKTKRIEALKPYKT